MKSLLDRAWCTFEEMEKGFNKVRKEMERLELLYDGSKLDKVDCYHERISWNGFRSGVFRVVCRS